MGPLLAHIAASEWTWCGRRSARRPGPRCSASGPNQQLDAPVEAREDRSCHECLSRRHGDPRDRAPEPSVDHGLRRKGWRGRRHYRAHAEQAEASPGAPRPNAAVVASSCPGNTKVSIPPGPLRLLPTAYFSVVFLLVYIADESRVTEMNITDSCFIIACTGTARFASTSIAQWLVLLLQARQSQ